MEELFAHVRGLDRRPRTQWSEFARRGLRVRFSSSPQVLTCGPLAASSPGAAISGLDALFEQQAACLLPAGFAADVAVRTGPFKLVRGSLHALSVNPDGLLAGGV